MLVTDLDVLKAVLMLRRCGNTYQTKEAQIEEQKRWLEESPDYANRFHEWIDSLREELKKAPEQLEEESRMFIEELSNAEAEQEYLERMSMRHERDEWDDYWDDRARSVGATLF